MAYTVANATINYWRDIYRSQWCEGFVCAYIHTCILYPCDYCRQMMAALAQLCAEVGCTIDRVTNELLGGIRALCIPATVYKACSTGYSQLTQKANVRYYSV